MHKSLAKYFVFLPGQALRGEYTLKYVHEFEKTQWFNPEFLEESQFNKLTDLIRYAAKFSPYYKNLYMDNCLNSDYIKCRDDLLCIPQITKDALRYNQQSMLIPVKHERHSHKTTGGSTGQAVTVIKSMKARAYQDAAMWRSLRWFGIDIGDKQARFWGAPVDPVTRKKTKFLDFAMNRIRLSAFSFDDQSIAEFINKIKIFRPKYFYGYTSMIKEITRYCEERQVDTKKLGIKTIITTSEPLHDDTRQYIKGVFKCEVVNDYGCGELGPIAYDCPEGGFHLMSDNLYIEIINDKGLHARDGEQGEIVVTELNNFYSPLIRYNLKDIAVASRRQCSCGRGLPLIENIIGRDRDILFSENGRKIHPAYINQIAQECKDRRYGLKQYQLVQKTRNYIVFKIIQDIGYSKKTEEFIIEKMKEVFGPSVVVDIKIVDKIEREKSGKLRVVKCEI